MVCVNSANGSERRCQRRRRDESHRRLNMAPTDAEAAPVLQRGSVISYGAATKPAIKDEDRYSAHCSEESDLSSAFGIFDGHSGADSATRCAAQDRNGLCGRILSADSPCDGKSIEQAFWDVDEALGISGCRSGTSATVLVCRARRARPRAGCPTARPRRGAGTTAPARRRRSPRQLRPRLRCRGARNIGCRPRTGRRAAVSRRPPSVPSRSGSGA